MFNSMNTREHYKMYKKGKTWIFAGIVTASLALGVVGGQTAHADTLAPDSTGEQDQSTVSDKSAAPDKQVVLDTTKTAGNVDDQKSDGDNPDATESAGDKTGDPAPVDKPAGDADKKIADNTTDTGAVVNNDDSSKVVNNLSRKAPAAPAAPAAPTARMAAPVVKADESIDAWMPNKTLQADMLSYFQGAYIADNPSIAASGKTWSTAADITQADMLLLNYVFFKDTYIDGKSSFSLKGLEYAKNLTHLIISDELNYAPYMIRADVTDLTPLQGLTKLTSLEVVGQRLTDITPIAGLKNITSLSIAQNCIADFSSLNAAQYSDLRLDQQLIENKVMYIPKTNEYVLVSPVKAPQGLTFTLDDIPTAIGVPITAPSHPESTVRIFWNGATGYSLDGEKISFTGIKDQIMPGQTENPWTQMYPNLVAEDYTYFLDVLYTTTINGNKVTAVQMVTPYIKADQAADVTVNYVDDSGNQVADPDTLTGFIGEDYTAVAKTIDGYELTKTPDNATGAFSDTAQTVTFVYKKVGGTVTPPVNPSQTVTMTVHYETSNGTKVAPDVILTGKAGDSYTSSPATVDGYKLVTTPANANGTFGNADGSITYVYAKTGGDGDLVTDGNGGDKPSTNKPGKPATKPGSGKTPTTNNGGQAATVTSNLSAKPGAVHAASLANTVDADKTTLPQTNDETTSPLWGLAVLGSLLGLVGFKRRKHNN
ncbi:MucBP domain-containing protein [Levilactobacillus tangyuanensis]|uniref:MucBP domain-containing protein n=1 Tax=Levilactobacillus tangyuanensis TaxID=2486021 RepID=A0ABW1TLI2_9LACO|nr:MucBP domain-containing protein [Levilactobacillus tangyuanensis]